MHIHKQSQEHNQNTPECHSIGSKYLSKILSYIEGKIYNYFSVFKNVWFCTLFIYKSDEIKEIFIFLIFSTLYVKFCNTSPVVSLHSHWNYFM